MNGIDIIYNNSAYTVSDSVSSKFGIVLIKSLKICVIKIQSYSPAFLQLKSAKKMEKNKNQKENPNTKIL